MDAALVVTRLDARIKGKPVNVKDTAKSYPLLCDTFGDGSGAADQQEAALTAPQRAALSQLAGSKGLTFAAESESSGVLKIGEADKPAASLSMEADLCVSRIDG